MNKTHKCYAQKDPIDIWVVHAVETNPPEEVRAIEWFLLTTLEVETAELCIRWYACRFAIF